MVVANFVFWFFLLLPFQFSLASVAGSDIPLIRLVIMVFFLGWLLTSLSRRKIHLTPPFILFALSAFLLWALLSLLWANNPTWSLRKVIFWCNFFPIFIVFYDLFQNELVRKKALQGLVWGGGIAATVGVIQFLSQFFVPLPELMSLSLAQLQFFLGPNFGSVVASYPSLLVNIGGVTLLRAFAFFPDPHIFAYYCGMMLPLAWYLAFQKEGRHIEKFFFGAFLVGTILSFSRASYVALLCATFAGIIVFSRYSFKKLSVGAILIFLSIIGLLFVSPVKDRLESSFSSQDGSVTERTRLWQEAATNISQRPLAGVGLGNYPLLVKPSAEPREPIYVHNLYLDIAVELGLGGLLLFLLFVGSSIPKGIKSNNPTFSYRWALVLSLLIFLTHSFFEYPLFSVHILTIFLALLALLAVEKKYA